MRTISAIMLCFLLIAGNVFAEKLTLEQDQELYNQILALTGRAPISQGSEDTVPEIIKCGTGYIMDIRSRLEGASEKTQALWISLLAARYGSQAPDTIGSPDGRFLIHYAASGTHGVLINDEFGIDPGTNVPEYVIQTADIFDSVYNFEVNYLAYDPPPVDGFYSAGIDDRYDVYILDLDQIELGNTYGATFQDSLFGSPRQYATSFIVIENDYSELSNYKDRPMDALKVTAAHEFFHAIQFAYDALEFEAVPNPDRRHWMEMSAVWMEDRMYDDINDYLYYLPGFFSTIYHSLISESPTEYEYGAVVWPKYLTQKWGESIVKKIWQLCKAKAGPNVFQNGFQDAIEEYSQGNETFASALAEFHTWLYFTGDRARPDFGIEESETWSKVPEKRFYISDSVDLILQFNEYPVEFNDPQYHYYPEHFGATYIRFSGFNQLDSSLHVTFNGIAASGGKNITWQNRIAGFNPYLPEGEVYVDPDIYGNSYTATLSEDLLSRFSEIIMVLTPYAETEPNKVVLSQLTFTLNVSDTSAPLDKVIISEPFPNPCVMSEPGNDAVFVEVLQPEPQTIKMQMHTLAGERVFMKEFPTTASYTLISWDGLNDSGEEVASGMYLMYISVGDVNKVSKIAIIE